MKQRVLLIVPAYGRSYTTIEAALADWRAGRDFKIPNGPYLSIRDTKHLIAAGYRTLNLLTSYPRPGAFTNLNLEEEHDAIPQN